MSKVFRTAILGSIALFSGGSLAFACGSNCGGCGGCDGWCGGCGCQSSCAAPAASACAAPAPTTAPAPVPDQAPAPVPPQAARPGSGYRSYSFDPGTPATQGQVNQAPVYQAPAARPMNSPRRSGFPADFKFRGMR